MHVVPSQVASGEQPKVQGSPGPGKALHTGFSKSVVSQKPEAQPMNPGQGEPLGIGAPQTEPVRVAAPALPIRATSQSGKGQPAQQGQTHHHHQRPQQRTKPGLQPAG